MRKQTDWHVQNPRDFRQVRFSQSSHPFPLPWAQLSLVVSDKTAKAREQLESCKWPNLQPWNEGVCSPVLILVSLASFPLCLFALKTLLRAVEVALTLTWPQSHSDCADRVFPCPAGAVSLLRLSVPSGGDSRILATYSWLGETAPSRCACCALLCMKWDWVSGTTPSPWLSLRYQGCVRKHSLPCSQISPHLSSLRSGLHLGKEMD